MNKLKTQSLLRTLSRSVTVAASAALVFAITSKEVSAQETPFFVSFDTNSAAHNTLSKLQDAGWDFTNDVGSAMLFELQAAPNLGWALVVGGDLPSAPRAEYNFEPLNEGYFEVLMVSTNSFSNGRFALEDADGNKLFAHLQISPVRFIVEAESGGWEDTTLPDDGSTNARNATSPTGYSILKVWWTEESVRWTMTNYRTNGAVNIEYSSEEAVFFEGGPPARVVLSTSTHNSGQRLFGFTDMVISGDPEYSGAPTDPTDPTDPGDYGDLVDMLFDFTDPRFSSLENLEHYGWEFGGQIEEIRSLGRAGIESYLYLGGDTEAASSAVLDLGGPVPAGVLNFTGFTRSSAGHGRVELLDRDRNLLFAFVLQAPDQFWVECLGQNIPNASTIPNGGYNDMLNQPRGYSDLSVEWDEDGNATWSWIHYLDNGTVNHQQLDQLGQFFTIAKPAYLSIRTLRHDHAQRAIGVANIEISMYEMEDVEVPVDGRDLTEEEEQAFVEFRERLQARWTRAASNDQVNNILENYQDGRFTNITYDNSGAAQSHFANLEIMILNYRNPAREYYQDPEMADKIAAGFDYWLDLDYQDWNWWNNFIGHQRRMTPASILFADVLESDYPETHEKVVAYFRRVFNRLLVNDQGGGANLADMSYNAIIGALIGWDIVQLEISLEQMLSTISIRDKDAAFINGTRADMTHLEHGPQFHNATYGHELLKSAIAGADLVHGTAWEFPEEAFDLMSRQFLEGIGRMSYGRWVDYNAAGRGMTRINSHSRGPGFASTLNSYIQLDPPRKEELQQLRLRLMANPSRTNYVNATTSFWDAEFISHIRRDYYTSVRLVSERSARNESGNSEGLRNRHFGDGINFTLVHGDEYDRMPAIWNYERLPGLTAEQNFTVQPESAWGVLGRNRYAGTTTDGQFGVAAMQVNHDGVTAKKSWFLFDDIIAAVGSDINGQPTFTPVFTTLNQTRWVGDIHYQSGNTAQQTISSTTTRSLSGDAWAWHRDIGYIIPQGNDQPIIEARPITGNYSNVGTANLEVEENVMTIWLNHGLNPSNKKYVYYTMPAATMEETAAMAANPVVELLHHDNIAHAVKHHKARTAGIAFFAAGEVALGNGVVVTSDNPVLVMLRNRLGRMEITVTDPEHRVDHDITLTVSMELSGEGVSYDETTGLSTIVLEMPQGNFRGAPKQVIFHIPGEPELGWSEVEDLGNGWKYLEGFGSYYAPYDRPFAYHNSFGGYVYLLSDDPSSIYIYDYRHASWYWTAVGIFPHVFSFAEMSWETL